MSGAPHLLEDAKREALVAANVLHALRWPLRFVFGDNGSWKTIISFDEKETGIRFLKFDASRRMVAPSLELKQ
jgi:hypothetical protein